MVSYSWVRVNRRKFSLIVKCFCQDLPSLTTSKLVGVTRNTTDRYFGLFRHLVIREAVVERTNIGLKNGVEIDESYFGPRRVRGKRGRGASKKIVVLGLRKRGGKVFTSIIPNAEKKTVLPIIRRVVNSGADIFTDGWRSYDALAVHGYNHKKVKHSEDEFVNGDAHINGVESFWSWAKRRMVRFNGIPRHRFSVFLLETEWRFNHRATIEKDVRKLINQYRKTHGL